MGDRVALCELARAAGPPRVRRPTRHTRIARFHRWRPRPGLARLARLASTTARCSVCNSGHIGSRGSGRSAPRQSCTTVVETPLYPCRPSTGVVATAVGSPRHPTQGHQPDVLAHIRSSDRPAQMPPTTTQPRLRTFGTRIGDKSNHRCQALQTQGRCAYLHARTLNPLTPCASCRAHLVPRSHHHRCHCARSAEPSYALTCSGESLLSKCASTNPPRKHGRARDGEPCDAAAMDRFAEFTNSSVTVIVERRNPTAQYS